MIGPLVSCAFITRGFRQPLLVRRFPVERARWEQFTGGNRNAAKRYNTIIGVPPFVDVLPGIVDLGDSEARVFIVSSSSSSSEYR